MNSVIFSKDQRDFWKFYFTYYPILLLITYYMYILLGHFAIKLWIVNNSLWSIKKILPSVCTLSSHPSGRGPRSSSGRLLTTGVVAWLGMGLARPVRGSTQDVVRSLWSMKNNLPLGALWMLQPDGRPSASPSRLFWELLLLVDDTVEFLLDELLDKLSTWSSLWNEEWAVF